MKKNILRGIMMITLLVLANISVVVSQGLYWESTTIITVANENKIHSTACYRPQMFKQESENQATIFRLDKEKIYHIDKQKKEYTEMTFAEMEAKMSEMKKQFENMPPAQREMMEKMMGSSIMGGKPDDPIEVTKTAEKKTISGYACVKYLMKENGKEIGSVWTTTAVPDFSAMQKDMKEFSKRMAALIPMKGGQIAEAMMKIEGFAIQTTMDKVISTVTKVEKRSIAASEFEIPAGYKKVDQKNIMGR